MISCGSGAPRLAEVSAWGVSSRARLIASIASYGLEKSLVSTDASSPRPPDGTG